MLHRVPKADGEQRWNSARRSDSTRHLAELFEEAPTPESYPEYYDKVAEVMDLRMIRENVRLYSAQ